MELKVFRKSVKHSSNSPFGKPLSERVFIVKNSIFFNLSTFEASISPNRFICRGSHGVARGRIPGWLNVSFAGYDLARFGSDLIRFGSIWLRFDSIWFDLVPI